jgi:hypothetical protein
MRRAKLLTRQLKRENISDSDIRKLAAKDMEKRLRINNDVKRMFKGFEQMGISEGLIYDTAKEKNYGKRRLALLYKGYMDRPVLSKDLRIDLAELGDEYVRRIKVFEDEVNKMPKFIPLD